LVGSSGFFVSDVISGVGKATENCWFYADFQVRIYHTLAFKVLRD